MDAINIISKLLLVFATVVHLDFSYSRNGIFTFIDSNSIEIVGAVKRNNMSIHDSIIVSLMDPAVIGVKRMQYVKSIKKVQYGLASWYGEGFKDKPTATTAIFDPVALTAAHRTLPIPSIASVTNLSNGKKIFVIINDRGPYVDKENRIIDLSRRGAQMLGFKYTGLAKVKVELEEELTNKIRGMYRRRDIQKSLSRRRALGYYNPAIFIRVFHESIRNPRVADMINTFVLTGAKSIFRNDAVFIGPMKYGPNAYMLFLTLQDMGISSKIVIA